jgi:hypothetical protein
MKRSKKGELMVLSAMTSDAIVWETKGHTVEGEFSRADKGIGAQNSNLYHFKGKGGKEFSVWGSASLDPILSVARKGEFLRITFTGKAKTKKGYQVRTFKVEGPKSLAGRLKTSF